MFTWYLIGMLAGFISAVILYLMYRTLAPKKEVKLADYIESEIARRRWPPNEDIFILHGQESKTPLWTDHTNPELALKDVVRDCVDAFIRTPK